jgi:hypothetical protein
MQGLRLRSYLHPGSRSDSGSASEAVVRRVIGALRPAGLFCRLVHYAREANSLGCGPCRERAAIWPGN